jgi:hypothetical protein
LLAGFYPTVSLRPERALVRFVPPGGYPDGGQPHAAGEPDEDRAPNQDEDRAPGQDDPDVSSDSPATSDPRAAQAPPGGG